MIIDDVVWNVIVNKHCSFRMKYLMSDSGLFRKISAAISITSPACATGNRVPLPTRSTPLSERKREFAIFI